MRAGRRGFALGEFRGSGPWGRVAIGIATLLLGAALWAPAGEAAVTETDWLGRVNEIRTASQLPPVAENDEWTAGIAAHLNYLGYTDPGYLAGPYASAHTENPASPYYTEAGDLEAHRSDLTYYSSSNVGAIDVWLEAPFHAIGMLRPGLAQIAFARDAASGRAGLDVIGGLVPVETPQQVLFPGPGSTIDLARFGGESPTPIETCEAQHPGADYSRAGLPLIALLTEAPEAGLTATLTQPDGRQIADSGPDLCTVTSQDYTTTDGVYGPSGRDILESDRAVLVIPRSPLVAGTYTVDIAQPGRAEIVWSFNSDPPPEPTTSEPASEVGSVVRRHLRVTFGRPGFGRRRAALTLDNRRGAEDVLCWVKSSAGYRHAVLVPAGQVRRPRVRLRRRGRTRVVVRVSGRLLASHTYRARRAHGRR